MQQNALLRNSRPTPHSSGESLPDFPSLKVFLLWDMHTYPFMVSSIFAKLDRHKAYRFEGNLEIFTNEMCCWTGSCTPQTQQQMPCCFLLSSFLEINLCISLRILINHLIPRNTVLLVISLLEALINSELDISFRKATFQLKKKYI